MIRIAKMRFRFAVCVSVFFSALISVGQAPESTDRPAATQKVIRDAAEYSAYITALNTQSPLERASAMEAFVATYPNSVVAEDALEEAMAAYQEAGDRGKVEATASRILQLDPDNVRALAPVVALMRLAHTEGQPTKKPATLRELADKGLKRIALWEKPEGMTERNFA